MLLIGGTSEINMEELQKITRYEGYTPESKTIKHFWEYVLTFDEEKKKKFMIFCTGTDRIPIGGLQSLKFVIQRHNNVKNLPSAQTCFNVLQLPDYQLKEIIMKKIDIIL